MTKRIIVITSWSGDGMSKETAYSPKVLTDFAGIGPVSCRDFVGVPADKLRPDPNINLVEISGDAAVIDTLCDALDTHTAYGPSAILLEEEVIDAAPA